VGAMWTRASILKLPRKKRSDAGSADVVRACEICGQSFTTTKSQVSSRPARYCSPQCVGVAAESTIYVGIIEDNSMPEPNSGCWLWTGAINGGGYGALRIGNKQWHAHRLSYVMAHGEPPALQPVIRHLCNNPSCVNPDHLAAGTTLDNAQDRVAAGTQVRGSQQHNAKLTEAWIPEIIAQHRAGATERGLARQYGVSQRTITFVLQGVTWKHASGL
jgi:hypothetical protein